MRSAPVRSVVRRRRNICNAGVDGASVFVPVGGLLVAGGNPFLGATGGLGGFGHLGVTLRVNGTQVVIPDFNYNGTGTTVAARQTIFAPAPLVEAGLGVFRGASGWRPGPRRCSARRSCCRPTSSTTCMSTSTRGGSGVSRWGWDTAPD